MEIALLSLESGSETAHPQAAEPIWQIPDEEIIANMVRTWPCAIIAKVYGPYLALRMYGKRDIVEKELLEVRRWTSGEIMWVCCRYAFISSGH